MGNQGKVQRVIRELVATLVEEVGADEAAQLLEMAAGKLRGAGRGEYGRPGAAVVLEAVGVGPATGCRQPLTRTSEELRPCHLTQSGCRDWLTQGIE